MYNKIILIGNIGKDVEKRDVGDQTVSNFSLATSSSYKDKNGEWQESTEWHNIVYWRNLPDFIQKGSQVFIEGKITTRKWQDKEGNDRYTTEVIASRVQVLGKKNENTMPELVSVGPDGKMNDLPF